MTKLLAVVLLVSFSATLKGGPPSVSASLRGGPPLASNAQQSGLSSIAREGQESAKVPPQNTAVVRGRVLRIDGLPLPGASVRLAPPPGSRGPNRTVQSELDGSFAFTDLPAGRFRLSASKNGFIGIEFGQRRPREPGRLLTIAAEQVLTRLDIVLPRPSAISGRIVDDGGEPIQRVSVQALRIAFIAGRRRLEPVGPPRATNDLGRYRLHGLQPGRYVVSATVGQVGTTPLPGYAPTYYPGTARPGEAAPITVELSQDTPGVDFALTPARTARISGKAVSSKGEAITGGITLSPSQRSGAATAAPIGARIRQDGTFEFANVAPGEYVVQVSRGRANPSTEGEFGMQYVSLNGADVTNLVVQTSAGAPVSGRVTVSGGSLTPRDVAIMAMPVDFDRSPMTGGPPATANISNTWSFTMAGLSGARIFMLGRVPDGWGLKGIYLDGNDITDTVIDFDARPRGLAGVEVVLTNQVSDLVGGVVNAANQPVDDYAVVVFSADRSRWTPRSRFVALARPHEDGTFRVRGLPPDEYYVAVLPWVDGFEWQDPELLDALAPRATRVTLAEGQSASLVATLIPR